MSRISLITVTGRISDDKDKFHKVLLGFVNPLNCRDYLGLDDFFFVKRPNYKANPADWDTQVSPIADKEKDLQGLREDITKKRHYAKLIENFGFFVKTVPIAFGKDVLSLPTLTKSLKTFNSNDYDRIFELSIPEDVWNYSDDGVIDKQIEVALQSLSSIEGLNTEGLRESLSAMLTEASEYFCLSYCQKTITYQRKSFFIGSSEYFQGVGDRIVTVSTTPLDPKRIVQVSKGGKSTNYQSIYDAIQENDNICFTDDYIFDVKKFIPNSNVITRENSTPTSGYFVAMPTFSAIKISESLSVQAHNHLGDEYDGEENETEEFDSKTVGSFLDLYSLSTKPANVLTMEVFGANVTDFSNPFIYTDSIAETMIKHNQSCITPYANLYPINNLIDSAFLTNPETKEPYGIQDIKGYSGKQNTIELYPEERSFWYELQELVNTGIALEQNVLRYETLRELIDSNTVVSQTVNDFLDLLIKRCYNINWAHTGITSAGSTLLVDSKKDSDGNSSDDSGSLTIETKIPYIVGEFHPDTNKYCPARMVFCYAKNEDGVEIKDTVDHILYVSTINNATLLDDSTLGDGFHDLMLTLSNYVSPYLHAETLLKLLRWGERKPRMLVYNLSKLSSPLYLDIATMTKQPFNGDTTSLTLIPEAETGVTSEIQSVIISTLFSDITEPEALREAKEKVKKLYPRLDLSSLDNEDGPIDLVLGAVLKDRLGFDGIVSPTYTQYTLVDVFSLMKRVESPIVVGDVKDKYPITFNEGKFEDSKGDEYNRTLCKDAYDLMSIDGNTIMVDLDSLTLEQVKCCGFDAKDAVALGRFSVEELATTGYDKAELENAKAELATLGEVKPPKAYSLYTVYMQNCVKYTKYLNDFVAKSNSHDVDLKNMSFISDYKSIFNNTNYLLRVLAAGKNLTANPNSIEMVASISLAQCYAIYNTFGSLLQSNLLSDGSLVSVLNQLYQPSQLIQGNKPAEADSKRAHSLDEVVNWMENIDLTKDKYVAATLEYNTIEGETVKLGVAVLTNPRKLDIGFFTTEEFFQLRNDSGFIKGMSKLSRRADRRLYNLNLSTIKDIRPLLGLGARLITYTSSNAEFGLMSTLTVEEFFKLIPTKDRERIMNLTKTYLSNTTK